MSAGDVPEGFERHTRRSALTDPWEPIYARRSEREIRLGFRGAAPHVNSRGFIHGGLICALADNAMGLSCGLHLTDISGLVTVSLSVDFVGTGRIGSLLRFGRDREGRAEPGQPIPVDLFGLRIQPCIAIAKHGRGWHSAP